MHNARESARSCETRVQMYLAEQLTAVSGVHGPRVAIGRSLMSCDLHAVRPSFGFDHRYRSRRALIINAECNRGGDGGGTGAATMSHSRRFIARPSGYSGPAVADIRRDEHARVQRCCIHGVVYLWTGVKAIISQRASTTPNPLETRFHRV